MDAIIVLAAAPAVQGRALRFVIHHATLSITSIAHMLGVKKVRAGEESRDTEGRVADPEYDDRRSIDRCCVSFGRVHQ